MKFKKIISKHKIPVIISCIMIILILTAAAVMIARSRQNIQSVSDIIENEDFEAQKPEPPRHTYNLKNIRDENGWKKYYDDNGNLISLYGIDVSYHQKDIDWQKVKNQGISFVMLRMGYRGYESGDLFIDSRFDEYAKGAADAGINVGVYFFSQSVNAEEAAEEARFVVNTLKDYEITYPVAYDWEPVEEKTSRTHPVDYPELTQSSIAFCDIIKDAGYTPVVYASRSLALHNYDLSRITGYDLWLAEYFDKPEYPYSFTMWQYSCDGFVDGIDGRVDLNICFKDYSQQTAASTETILNSD